ncbi:MAG: hypothetical protein QGH20_02980, partial [Candidatus Latescibacteria bacterium]|nr:hypothetical protein [Candidatus Latescibacterota bacterium]
MGDRVFERLAEPQKLKDRPLMVFAADPLVSTGIRGLGTEWFPTLHTRNRAEFLQLCRDTATDGYVDGVLMTIADAEVLALKERFFDNIDVTPLVRFNAETNIWNPRHGRYRDSPSIPFTTVQPAQGGICSIDQSGMECARDCSIRLGLYSLTLNNDVEADWRSLRTYLDFAADVAKTPDLGHFLEVFLPNVNQPGMDNEAMGQYVADSITRTMAYLRADQRPAFIKTAYTTAEVWKEFCDFDPTLAIGALGGARINARKSLQLAHDVTEYGGVLILFGRNIYQEDNPRAMCKALRAVLDRTATVDQA